MSDLDLGPSGPSEENPQPIGPPFLPIDNEDPQAIFAASIPTPGNMASQLRFGRESLELLHGPVRRKVNTTHEVKGLTSTSPRDVRKQVQRRLAVNTESS